MIFKSKLQKRRAAAILGSALGLLLIAAPVVSAAPHSDGNFHIKAINEPDPAFWGIYPKLKLGTPGEEGGENGGGSPGTENPDEGGAGGGSEVDPGDTTPNPNPTNPPVVTNPGTFEFTLASGIGCSSPQSFYIENPEPGVTVHAPNGENIPVAKSTSGNLSMVSTLSGGFGSWSITGKYQRIVFSNNQCLTSVTRWSDTGVTSGMQSFFKASNLIHVAEIPSTLVDGGQMFQDAVKFNSNVANWETSNLRSAQFMFANTPAFTGSGLENWKTSNLTTTANMFTASPDANRVFNPNLGSWDMRNVTDARFMFFNNFIYEGKGLENWSMPKLEYAGAMFGHARNFNADLTKLKPRLVDAQSMFTRAKAFQGTGLSTWDASRISDMSNMFSYADRVSEDLSSWKACKLTTTSSYKFWNASSGLASATAKWPKFGVCS